MTLIDLSYDEAKQLLSKAVEEFGPDYVYPHESCVYFLEDGTPACIVGQVFAAKGVGLADMAEAEAEYPSLSDFDQKGVLGASVTQLRRAALLHLDRRTHSLLSCVQSMQDSGFSWGQALARGVKWAEEVPA